MTHQKKDKPIFRAGVHFLKNQNDFFLNLANELHQNYYYKNQIAKLFKIIGVSNFLKIILLLQFPNSGLKFMTPLPKLLTVTQ